MLSILNTVSGSKFSLLLISLIAISTIVDSQFIRLFYTTDLGTPGNFHFILFVSLVLFASIINILFIRFAKTNDTEARSSRPLLFKAAYICTIGAQIAVLLIIYLVVSEMLIFHAYNRIFLLLAVVISHFLSAFILGTLCVIFLQWFRFGRSLSILTYASVFIVILFLVFITVPLLMATYSIAYGNTTGSISTQPFINLVLEYIIPTSDIPFIAFVYGLGNYALPIMAIASWMLTVSLKDIQTE